MIKLSDEFMNELHSQYDFWFNRRELWNDLSNNHFRMRRLGGLQTTMEKVERKAVRANNMIAKLIKRFNDAVKRAEDQEAMQKIEIQERAEFERLSLKYGNT